MCGGQLFILPCSRVGHVNKEHIVNRTGVTRAVTYNNLRLVHVWLGEYKVKHMFLVWKAERAYRGGPPLQKSSAAFPDSSFCSCLCFPSISSTRSTHLQTLFSCPPTSRLYFQQVPSATLAPYFSFLGKLKFLRSK